MTGIWERVFLVWLAPLLSHEVGGHMWHLRVHNLTGHDITKEENLWGKPVALEPGAVSKLAGHGCFCFGFGSWKKKLQKICAAV